MPASPKDYIHRVGRTARAGRGGMAITLMTQYDVDRVKQIEATINTNLVEFETNENEVLPLLRAVMVAKGEVQSCCFANQTYCFFCRSRCRRRGRC